MRKNFQFQKYPTKYAQYNAHSFAIPKMVLLSNDISVMSFDNFGFIFFIQ